MKIIVVFNEHKVSRIGMAHLLRQVGDMIREGDPADGSEVPLLLNHGADRFVQVGSAFIVGKEAAERYADEVQEQEYKHGEQREEQQ